MNPMELLLMVIQREQWSLCNLELVLDGVNRTTILKKDLQDCGERPSSLGIAEEQSQ